GYAAHGCSAAPLLRGFPPKAHWPLSDPKPSRQRRALKAPRSRGKTARPRVSGQPRPSWRLSYDQSESPAAQGAQVQPIGGEIPQLAPQIAKVDIDHILGR